MPAVCLGGGRRFVPAPATESVTAPVAPFEVGTEVGVPTGTSLTATTGVPTEDATESLTLTHPVTGAGATLTVKVWRHRSWSDQMLFNPPSGETWLFDECEFVSNGTFWTVGVDQAASPSIMAPRAVFRRCTANGSDTTSRAGALSSSWVLGGHFTGGADGIDDGSYCVIQDSNIIATTSGGGAEEHSDGFQSTGDGRTTLYHNWTSAGTGPGASQSIRFGNEFSGLDDINVYYCGIDRGGWSLQIAGDGNPDKPFTNVTIIGNRWTRNSGFGPYDIEIPAVELTWTDNAWVDEEVIVGPNGEV